jgi:uncharacterized protein (TIGR02444 family)
MNCGNNHEFWTFALDLYAVPGAQDALLNVQDVHGGDVMAVLWALAASAEGKRLSHSDIATYTAATASAAQTAIECRSIRKRLKSDPKAAYTAAKADELAAERAVAASAPDPFQAGIESPDQQSQLTSSNLALILDALTPPVPPTLRKTLIRLPTARKA